MFYMHWHTAAATRSMWMGCKGCLLCCCQYSGNSASPLAVRRHSQPLTVPSSFLITNTAVVCVCIPRGCFTLFILDSWIRFVHGSEASQPLLPAVGFWVRSAGRVFLLQDPPGRRVDLDFKPVICAHRAGAVGCYWRGGERQWVIRSSQCSQFVVHCRHKLTWQSLCFLLSLCVVISFLSSNPHQIQSHHRHMSRSYRTQSLLLLVFVGRAAFCLPG